MSHQILPIKVKNWDIVFVFVKPPLVFWLRDVNLLQLELEQLRYSI